jgi:hypothetical protein
MVHDAHVRIGARELVGDLRVASALPSLTTMTS